MKLIAKPVGGKGLRKKSTFCANFAVAQDLCYVLRSCSCFCGVLSPFSEFDEMFVSVRECFLGLELCVESLNSINLLTAPINLENT